jgi:hypothetical protein
MGDGQRDDVLARLRDLEVEPALVDNEESVRTVASPQEEEQREHRAELERREREKDQQIEQAAEVVPTLRLAQVNLERGQEAQHAFRDAGPDGDEAERLLLELVAGEVPVLLQLRDLEAANAALLGRTITNPELSAAVLKVAKETSAWLTAVRARAQTTMGVVADLRAQRRFLSAHRRKLGD